MDNIKERLDAILKQKITEEVNRRSQALESNKKNYDLYAKGVSDYSQFKSAVELLVAEANSSSLSQLGYTLLSEFQDAGALTQLQRYQQLVENPQAQILPNFGIQGRILMIRTGQRAPYTSSPTLSIEFHGRGETTTATVSEPKSSRRIQIALDRVREVLGEELISFIQRNLRF